MKHTPTIEQIRTLKITMEEEIDRNGNEYEDVNENCRYWLNNINEIVHAVNMHELLLATLKQAVESLVEFGCEDIVYYKDIIKKAERK